MVLEIFSRGSKAAIKLVPYALEFYFLKPDGCDGPLRLVL